jgi:hypothetical protein
VCSADLRGVSAGAALGMGTASARGDSLGAGSALDAGDSLGGGPALAWGLSSARGLPSARGQPRRGVCPRRVGTASAEGRLWRGAVLGGGVCPRCMGTASAQGPASALGSALGVTCDNRHCTDNGTQTDTYNAVSPDTLENERKIRQQAKRNLRIM